MTKIAIIGAGLAGISLARALPEHADITIFEKSRGIGGRMATRYAGDYEFDHGAQFFTAKTENFSKLISDQKITGNIREWAADIALFNGARETSSDKFVASPRMNTLCKTLAEGLDVRRGVHINKLDRTDNVWHLQDTAGETYDPFEWVISAAPAPQASALLPAAFSGHARLETVRMSGCFALMLGFATEIELPWPAARIAGSSVGWITLNSEKPGRQSAASLLIQSSNDWAEVHLEDDPDDIQAILLKDAADLLNIDLGTAAHTAFHRWRYAATPTPAGTEFLLDESNQLAVCGDWCLGSRVEAAFTSGQKLGERLGDLV